jgi:hypothetical protein
VSKEIEYRGKRPTNTGKPQVRTSVKSVLKETLYGGLTTPANTAIPEACASVKRALLWKQKRLTIGAKETYLGAKETY